MKLYLPDKVTDIQSLNANFERGTSGTEQRGGCKVVVFGCSKEFCNAALDLYDLEMFTQDKHNLKNEPEPVMVGAFFESLQ